MEERVNVKFLFILVTSIYSRSTRASVLKGLHLQIAETVSQYDSKLDYIMHSIIEIS